MSHDRRKAVLDSKDKGKAAAADTHSHSSDNCSNLGLGCCTRRTGEDTGCFGFVVVVG